MIQNAYMIIFYANTLPLAISQDVLDIYKQQNENTMNLLQISTGYKLILWLWIIVNPLHFIFLSVVFFRFSQNSFVTTRDINLKIYLVLFSFLFFIIEILFFVFVLLSKSGVSLNSWINNNEKAKEQMTYYKNIIDNYYYIANNIDDIQKNLMELNNQINIFAKSWLNLLNSCSKFSQNIPKESFDTKQEILTSGERVSVLFIKESHLNNLESNGNLLTEVGGSLSTHINFVASNLDELFGGENLDLEQKILLEIYNLKMQFFTSFLADNIYNVFFDTDSERSPQGVLNFCQQLSDEAQILNFNNSNDVLIEMINKELQEITSEDNWKIKEIVSKYQSLALNIEDIDDLIIVAEAMERFILNKNYNLINYEITTGFTVNEFLDYINNLKNYSQSEFLYYDKIKELYFSLVDSVDKNYISINDFIVFLKDFQKTLEINQVDFQFDENILQNYNGFRRFSIILDDLNSHFEDSQKVEDVFQLDFLEVFSIANNINKIQNLFITHFHMNKSDFKIMINNSMDIISLINSIYDPSIFLEAEKINFVDRFEVMLSFYLDFINIIKDFRFEKDVHNLKDYKEEIIKIYSAITALPVADNALITREVDDMEKYLTQLKEISVLLHKDLLQQLEILKNQIQPYSIYTVNEVERLYPGENIQKINLFIDFFENPSDDLDNSMNNLGSLPITKITTHIDNTQTNFLAITPEYFIQSLHKKTKQLNEKIDLSLSFLKTNLVISPNNTEMYNSIFNDFFSLIKNIPAMIQLIQSTLLSGKSIFQDSSENLNDVDL